MLWVYLLLKHGKICLTSETLPVLSTRHLKHTPRRPQVTFPHSIQLTAMLLVPEAHGYLTDLLLGLETHILPSSVAPDRSTAHTIASAALLWFHRGQALGLSRVASLWDLTANMALVFKTPKDQESRNE